ncbi:arginase, partial [Salinisphaera sp. USBA-960]|nr:arginase [Salifodinibacter halophilus]
MSTDRTQPIALLGVPLEAGTGRRGAAMGPAALRVAGLAERLEALGWSVSDFGDVEQLPAETIGALHLPGRAHVPEIVASWVRPLAHEARRLCDEGYL